MNQTLDPSAWCVRKIAVVGPGIVGMPMAAMLAHAEIKIGRSEPAKVMVIQRDSPTSGWKVAAINRGESPIGGIEPDLDTIVSEAVSKGLLRASHDYREIRDADVILVCVQTDKKGIEPDYGPLLGALEKIAENLRDRRARERRNGSVPLIIFESTLAPSTMSTVIRTFFERYGLIEGRDILLGNSPNRVMPGRLVERLKESDKIVAGLSEFTPALIDKLYANVVTDATLHKTNSLTAEIVKTLENAYRDVRIAYTSEIVRYCDEQDIDFYQVRAAVNQRLAQHDDASDDPNAVPSGGLLIPTVGVGGHCLPKDGILLWWRKLETGADTSASLILESRRINDESPNRVVLLAEKVCGNLSGRHAALLGAAYRFNSEDTRNSPTLALAQLLLNKGCSISIHDPYVKPGDQNLVKYELNDHFTRNMDEAVSPSHCLIFCTAHRVYHDEFTAIAASARNARCLVDGCNLFDASQFKNHALAYTGIGRGGKAPDPAFIDFVCQGFRTMERGVANEVSSLVDFYNENYAHDTYNRVRFTEVRRIAGTCVTGCTIADTGPVETVPAYHGFSTRLSRCAKTGSGRR
jgi:UDP-N-acetyl-D-mannosaminuronic acid dehydrogenase